MPQERNHVSAGATDGDSYPTITTESGASGIAPDHSSGLPRDASGGTHGSITKPTGESQQDSGDPK
jgi:hypothetical protein